MWKFPGQGLNPHHSSDLSCCSDTGYLTHWNASCLSLNWSQADFEQRMLFMGSHKTPNATIKLFVVNIHISNVTTQQSFSSWIPPPGSYIPSFVDNQFNSLAPGVLFSLIPGALLFTEQPIPFALPCYNSAAAPHAKFKIPSFFLPQQSKYLALLFPHFFSPGLPDLWTFILS